MAVVKITDSVSTTSSSIAASATAVKKAYDKANSADANSGVTSGNYGPTGNVNPAHGGSFTVPYFTVNSKGKITAAATRTIRLPADNNTHCTYCTHCSYCNAFCSHCSHCTYCTYCSSSHCNCQC